MPSANPNASATVTADAKVILIALPARDYDLSEVAVAWRIITNAGHRVVFAAPQGLRSAADPLMLSGADTSGTRTRSRVQSTKLEP